MEQRLFLDPEVAARYDASSRAMFDPALLDSTVDVLGSFAAGGSALEFGVGTGRVALPLSARGVRVHGVDLSVPMLDQLRAKAGSEAIELTVANFARVKLATRFDLVYLVFNAITAFTTQDEQVDAFLNAGEHVRPGGHVLTETWVPALQRLAPGDSVRADKVTPSHLMFDEYDVVTQRCTSHHYERVGAGWRTRNRTTDICGHRSSTSWRDSRVWSCERAGQRGRARRSTLTARTASPSGRNLRADRTVRSVGGVHCLTPRS